LPVIHPVSVDIALRSVRTAVDAGAHGICLIDQGMSAYEVLMLTPLLYDAFLRLWIGGNILAFTVDKLLMHTMDLPVRRTWRDNAYIEEHDIEQPRAALLCRRADDIVGGDGTLVALRLSINDRLHMCISLMLHIKLTTGWM
jgi:hypothetical protein